MKQENYKFVDLVSGIFLLILFFFNFLALLYIFDGNQVFSGLVSFFITTLYFFVVEQMRKNKESLIRQGFKHFSLLFISFFLLLSFISFILMSHVINVEFNAKQDIQDEAQKKLQLVSDFVSQYETRSSADLANYQSQLGLRGYTQDIVLGKVKIFQSRVNGSKLFLKNKLTQNNEKFNKVFQNWQRLSLMKTYANLNQYLINSEAIVNKKLSELPVDKTPIVKNIKITTTNQLPLNSVLKLNKVYPPKYGFTFLIILVVHLGILLSFFLTKTRGPGAKFDLSIQAKKLVREIN
jgi:hypothetical protein